MIIFRHVLVIVLFMGCNQGIKKSEYDRVVAELDEIKFGASRLLASAGKLMDSGYDDEAIEEFGILIERHPESEEAITAKTNIAKLEKKKEVEIKDKQRALDESLKNMRKETDDISGISWYRDRTTTKYNNRNSIHLYIGDDASRPPCLKFRIQYLGDSWLFIRSYIIKCDDETFTYRPYDVKRDNGSSDTWEWSDDMLNKKTLDIVKAIISSKSAKIRHNGSEYYKDRTVSAKEKKALQRVLDAYEALGGKLKYLKS